MPWCAFKMEKLMFGPVPKGHPGPRVWSPGLQALRQSACAFTKLTWAAVLAAGAR